MRLGHGTGGRAGGKWSLTRYHPPRPVCNFAAAVMTVVLRVAYVAVGCCSVRGRDTIVVLHTSPTCCSSGTPRQQPLNRLAGVTGTKHRVWAGRPGRRWPRAAERQRARFLPVPAPSPSIPTGQGAVREGRCQDLVSNVSFILHLQKKSPIPMP